MDSLSTLGLPIWITELDSVVDSDVKRADVLEKILRTAYAHPAVEGVVLWTFWDRHAWKKNASLFDGHKFKVGFSQGYSFRTQCAHNVFPTFTYKRP